eukprot:3459979-Amphidinium_carterae.1
MAKSRVAAHSPESKSKLGRRGKTLPKRSLMLMVCQQSSAARGHHIDLDSAKCSKADMQALTSPLGAPFNAA